MCSTIGYVVSRSFNCHDMLLLARTELQELCQEVDKKEQEKANLKTGNMCQMMPPPPQQCQVLLAVLGELEQMRAALASATERERELFVPQQYEATFERKLYRHTLGLDIRLTQGGAGHLCWSE